MKTERKKNFIIIPARYDSQRFPGKVLKDLSGRPMLDWVYKNAVKSNLADDVFIATDSSLVYDEMEKLGNHVIRTSSKPTCGTERCAEVAGRMNLDGNIINVQGDQPFVCAAHLDAMFEYLARPDAVFIVSLCIPLEKDKLNNPNRVKVYCNEEMMATEFSRHFIPHKDTSYEHIGIYGFGQGVLSTLADLPMTEREESLKLEQLRWMDHGYAIRMIEADGTNISIDTPDDLVEATEYLEKTGLA